MSMIKASETNIERILGKAMFSLGLRYRKQLPIVGKPDFAFLSEKIAVFCDGSFWHGKEWDTAKERIRTNRDFWWPKIEKNMKRDQEVNDALEKSGWLVIRFWDTDIYEDSLGCAVIVKEAVVARRKRPS